MELSNGLDHATITQLNAILSDAPVTRELHAFCRLCPPTAGPRLLALPPAQLTLFSEQCRLAIDAWLCCDRTYEVMRDVPSLTTRDSSLPSKVCNPNSHQKQIGLHSRNRRKPGIASVLSPELVVFPARYPISFHIAWANHRLARVPICGRF